MSQNIGVRPLNITSILNNFKSLIKQVYQKGCTHKFNKKNDQNIYFRVDSSQRWRKLLTLKEKNQIDF